MPDPSSAALVRKRLAGGAAAAAGRKGRGKGKAQGEARWEGG